MDDILCASGLSKRFKDFEIKDMTLTLKTGAITGFIGENGAGKTTTIKLLLNVLRRDCGTVRIFGGECCEKNRSVMELVGFVPDEPLFPDSFTLKNIDGVMKNIYKTWNSERFFALAERLGLSLTRPKDVKAMSRGMKLKLAIAAALAHDTRLLIMDEPFSGLDPVARDELKTVLMEFTRDESRSVFLSSHIVSDLERFCDYIAFIKDGALVFNRSIEELGADYGMLRGSEREIMDIPPAAVVARRSNSFGCEALVLNRYLRSPAQPASLEDIMVFYSLA